MSKKILHIAGCDKFIPPFIEFLKENFDIYKHEFLLTNGMAAKDLKLDLNIHLAKKTVVSMFNHYLKALIKMHKSDKIILHGLFDPYLVIMLFCMPWLLKKSYWVMWGGDLYYHQLATRNWKYRVREFFRRPVIKNMGYLVTYIKGDIELARKWYKAEGVCQECLMYPSNLYKNVNIKDKNHKGINILVGNSADPTNNHFEVFDKLEKYADMDINLIVPLAYGDKDYAKKVASEGEKVFGNKFQPILELIALDEYLKILSEIDIAVFNHKRQQAMGNTISLLGMEKKVYIRRGTTTWRFFEEKKIKVFDIDEIESLSSDNSSSKDNKSYIKSYFSKENYKKQLIELFK